MTTPRTPFERHSDHAKRLRREELRRATQGPVARHVLELSWADNISGVPIAAWAVPWQDAARDTSDAEWAAADSDITIIRDGLWRAHVYADVRVGANVAPNSNGARTTCALYVNGDQVAAAVSGERPGGGATPRSTPSVLVSPPLVLTAGDIVHVALLIGIGGDGSATAYNLAGQIVLCLDFMCALS